MLRRARTALLVLLDKAVTEGPKSNRIKGLAKLKTRLSKTNLHLLFEKN